MPTYLADDAADIAKRQGEMRAERERDENIEIAAGPALDMLGRRVGVERVKDESDYALRTRVKAEIKRAEELP